MTTTLETATVRPPATAGYGQSLLIGLGSAAAFGLSGVMGRSMLDLGWTPTAVVSARILGGFIVLLIPTLVLLRRIGRPDGRQWSTMVLYGLIAVGGAQLCYFSAVQYLPVGVALLLEYSAPVLLIGWHWARSRKRPTAPVLLGAAASIVGLILVLDLRGGFSLNPIGVFWGLAAAVCLCGYFILAEAGDPERAVHPLLLTTVGFGVGGSAVLVVGAVGLLPLAARTGMTRLAGATVPWWLPMIVLVLVCAVLSYLTGIAAVRRLGSSIASFVALTEVIFAVVFAFVLLAQQPTLIQLIGGLLVLSGIAIVQARRPATLETATTPATP